MRFAWLLIPTLASAATLTISPPVIYDCTGTVGKATLEWSGASGPVYIGVGPAQVQMTGFGGSAGKAETGTWVGDGLEFRLVNQSGGVEAVAFAKVRCNEGELPGNGIVGASYFPLEVGNTWIYRYNTRQITSDYVTWKVAGLRQVNGRTYAEISVTSRNSTSTVGLFREENGRIWRSVEGTEELYLDPGASTRVSFSNSLGSFPDAVTLSRTQSIGRATMTFVRGLGLARWRNDLLTGSSGGFVDGGELVYVKLATGPRIYSALPKISVSAESRFLDVTHRNVPDCYVPAYCVACGLVGADAPGTYRPCMQTRVEASANSDFWTELSLLNNANEVVFRTPLMTADGAESVRYIQVPLYSKPNEPLPAGTYRLVGRMGEAANETGTASMTIEIR